MRRHASGFDPHDVVGSGVTAVAGADDIEAGRRAVRGVQLSPEVAGYVVDVARATRQAPSLGLGASPRGAVSLMRTARAWAWLSGRDFVTPDDVKALAQATLAHRLSLRPEAELEGVDVERRPRLRARLRPGPPLSDPRRWRSPGASRCCSCWGWWRSCCARRSARCGCGCWSCSCSSGSTWRWPPPRPDHGGAAAGRPGPGRGRSPPARWSSATTAPVVRRCWSATPGSRPPARRGNRHRLRLGPGDRTLVTTSLRPERRGELRRVGRHAAERGTARARGAADHPRGARAGSGPCPRSSPASTCPRGSPGSATSTAGRRSGCAGRGPSSTRCASTSAATTSAPSTGGPAHATAPSWCAPGSPSATGGSCSCSTPRASRPVGSRTCRGSTPRWRRPCC